MNQNLCEKNLTESNSVQQPRLVVLDNPCPDKIALYRIARIIYAETKGNSLPVKEAFASMIQNRKQKLGLSLEAISDDKNLFGSLNHNSKMNQDIFVSLDNPEFAICLRLAKRIVAGNLSDVVFGAVRFHHDDENPAWALAEGYVYQLNDLLFYL